MLLKDKINMENLKKIQDKFNKSMKIIEKHVAESIVNKIKLEKAHKNSIEANLKFSEAEKYLIDLKKELEN